MLTSPADHRKSLVTSQATLAKNAADFSRSCAAIDGLPEKDRGAALNALSQRLPSAVKGMSVEDGIQTSSRFMASLGKLTTAGAGSASRIHQTATAALKAADAVGEAKLQEFAARSEALGNENEQHMQTMRAVQTKLANKESIGDSEIAAFFAAKDRMGEISQALGDLKAERDSFNAASAPLINAHRAEIRDGFQSLMKKPGMLTKETMTAAMNFHFQPGNHSQYGAMWGLQNFATVMSGAAKGSLGKDDVRASVLALAEHATGPGGVKLTHDPTDPDPWGPYAANLMQGALTQHDVPVDATLQAALDKVKSTKCDVPEA